MNIILGATGTIGRHLVPLAAARSEPVRIVSRSEASAAPLRDAQVHVVLGDLRNREVVDGAFAGARRIFFAIDSSPAQEEVEFAIIEGAQRAGVEHLVKVSVIDPSPEHVVALARVHQRIETALAGSGIPHTILRPNWFMQNFFGSAATLSQGALYGSAGTGEVAFVDARDIAAVADAVLANPSAHSSDLEITGPAALTFAQAAEAIGAGLGKRVQYADLAESAFSDALAAAGLPGPVVEVVLQINRNARRGGLSRVSNVVPTTTGRAARTLEAFARDHAAQLGR